MLIIGITGTIGAGKGTVVDYLTSRYGFKHYSVRKYLTELLQDQGIEPNRDHFTALANSLREKNNSPSFIIEELYRTASMHGDDAIIESIRTLGEIDKLRTLDNFILLAVDAEQSLRYQRVFARNSETDAIGYEKFKSDEDREMKSSNPNNQNLADCIALADYTIFNNDGLTELHEAIDHIIEKITKVNKIKDSR
jgi:dephospho-CoA kinase